MKLEFINTVLAKLSLSSGPVLRHLTESSISTTAGLENCTRPLVFTSESSVRASGNCHLLARQDELIFLVL